MKCRCEVRWWRFVTGVVKARQESDQREGLARQVVFVLRLRAADSWTRRATDTLPLRGER